ncbi:MAG: AAA family ATPase [bacterium]
MHLESLELVGFKTFAQKTILNFDNGKGKPHHITAVVGPNGSGKSNIADSVRWVLGEQSLKLLRGKNSEDVIFSGSEGRGRSGFAEATITINNEDKRAKIDYAQIVISRRLYRDGDSEYLLNGNNVRLSDIQLLLAEANFGQRSYGVIAQGMIDHVLVAAPHERKEFFDDAAGVKSLQLKRHQAELKLDRSEDNLKQAQTILAEIVPHLKALERQMNRLKQREDLERDLGLVQGQYYGGLWHELVSHEGALRLKLATAEAALDEKKKKVDEANATFAGMEKYEEETGDLSKMQASYQELVREKTKLEHARFELERKIAVQKIRLEKPFVPLPLSKIIAEIDAIVRELGTCLKGGKDVLATCHDSLSLLHERAHKLLTGLQRPPDDEKPKEDPVLLAELAELTKLIEAFNPKIRESEMLLADYSKNEQKKKGALFELQRSAQVHQRALFDLERSLNEVRVEIARVETRRETLNEEMHGALGEEQVAGIKNQENNKSRNQESSNSLNHEQLREEMFSIKRKLEFIGGIDPGVPQEFEEVKARHDHLTTQITDLDAAIIDTKKIMKELGEEIQSRSEAALKILNREFERYFKKIFGGGIARILEVRQEVTEEELALMTDEEKAEVEKTKGLVGVDIQATPPGKKLKSINLLSGGERAMTSLALIAAIISMNPSPFVILDEVDAALDEANSRRYAEILKELSERTQFVIITHNRTTMETADILYGVTMGTDGISKLLSVKLEEIGSYARQ